MFVRYVEAKTQVQHAWKPTGADIQIDSSNKSSLHVRTRKLLQRMFPTVSTLEEVSFSPVQFKTLYLDFYIPVLHCAVEVHGEQHYKFVPHYHGTMLKFMQARKNDNMKKDWCILNNIIFIELPFNETDKEWERRINGQ